MSVTTIAHILDRIKAAPSTSPVAVFRAPAKRGLDAVIAATVVTRQRIARADPALVGVFWCDSDLHVTRQLLAAEYLAARGEL